MQSQKRTNEFPIDINNKKKKSNEISNDNTEKINEMSDTMILENIKNTENGENFNKNMELHLDDEFKQIEGICCFCGYECNVLSQSCGKCAREYTMRMFNWK